MIKISKYWPLILLVLLAGVIQIGWTASVPSGALALQEAITQVAQQVTPAVVHIRCESLVKAPQEGFNPFDDPFFRQFFGPFGPFGFQGPAQPKSYSRKQIERKSGSGMIIDSKGYILTNNHVVEDASKIMVTFMPEAGLGDEPLPAKVVGRDPRTDIAVLKVNADKPLPVVQLGDSDKIKVGEWAIAIGSPFGLRASVTLGIVSAVGRSEYDLGMNDPAKALFGLIQTDASINPGNSGGPLVDIEGKVIGVNLAIISPNGGNIGLGFALPINTAKRVARQLIEHGKVRRGWLGVTITDLDKTMAHELGLKGAALISEINPAGPAAKAGLKPFDIITKVNDTPITGATSLTQLIGRLAPGTKVQVHILRQGKARNVTVTLGEMPEDLSQAAAPAASPGALGLSVAPLTPDQAAQYGLQGKGGVVVTSVEPGSPAYNAGLAPGDCIVQIGTTRITDVDAFKSALAANADRKVIPFYVKRRTQLGVSSLILGVRPKS